MAKFSNALNLYRRVDTIEVDCGSFSVELRSYHSLFKELGDEQIRLRSEGILPKVEATPQPRKRLISSAARMKGKEAPVQQETSEYLLGSLERDQRFFAEKVMVNWHNLVDDDGVEIPYEEVLKWEDFTYQPYSPRSFAYCSDTAPFEQLHQWVEGVDLLYHEGTFGEELKEMAAATLHSTVTDAAGCARRAGVGKLVIGHYSSRYKNTDELLVQARQIFENTFSAKEGAIFDVPLNKYK